MAVQAVPTNQPPSYAIQEILGAPNLTGHIKACTTGIPNPFPMEFFSTSGKYQVIGDYATVIMSTGSRQTARRSPYGSPHKERSLRPLGERQYKFVPTYEKMRLPQLLYDQLLNPESTGIDIRRQNEGEFEIYRQVGEFKAIFSNLRIGMMVSALGYGAVNFDELGNLMSPTAAVPSGGLAVTIPIPNGTSGIPVPDTNVVGINISTVNTVGLDPFNTGTAIFGAAVGGGTLGTWANNNTHIEQQIYNLKIAAEQLTGLPLRHCFYGANIPNYLMNNSWLNWYGARNAPINAQYLDTGEIPDGFLGLKWHRAGQAYFIDQTNTKQSLWGANRVMLCPDVMADTPNQIVCQMEGSSILPRDVGEIVDDGRNIKGRRVFGMYCYGKENDDPQSIGIFGGDVSLPGVLNPLAFFGAEVA